MQQFVRTRSIYTFTTPTEIIKRTSNHHWELRNRLYIVIAGYTLFWENVMWHLVWDELIQILLSETGPRAFVKGPSNKGLNVLSLLATTSSVGIVAA